MNPDFFHQIRTEIDYALQYDGNSVNEERFKTLFDEFAPLIADYNYNFLEADGADDDDLGAFGDSTLKHQVFDYFPYEEFPKRKYPDFPTKPTVNDLSSCVAGIVAINEHDEEMRNTFFQIVYRLINP